MTRAGSLLLLLTAIVAALAGILAFAVSKFFAAARAATKAGREGGAETVFMAAAMEEALQKMRTQERAMQARAEASERLSGEIIASMTSGLLVVSQEGMVSMLNPAGQQLLGLPDSDWLRNYRDVLKDAAPLADVIKECLIGRRPIVRRTVRMDRPVDASHLGITVSPIRDVEGHEHGAICLFTDFRQDAGLDHRLRLTASVAPLGGLPAGIAHQFRNGLASIPGYSPLLDLARLPADFKPSVQRIREETEELGQAVTNLLTFA